MTSAELRQSFLDFFADKGHAIVPSAPLLPESPNLLFTNAGMNPFVPYFLGERQAPWKRAADTQKCIRAGGKHNDLEDVGFDTYHQTFFEMLGNWSFGDYFKDEAIEYAWELLTRVWGFPKERLYATVYRPGPGDPAAFDQEAYDRWVKRLSDEGLDPEKHVLFGDKTDNFWMMGDTGPCGPCSEIHMDLTPDGDAGGSLVNADSPWCMEIWNLVFIQFNAEPDGRYVNLPARHVDTGMGFERVAGIMATTRGFTDFSKPPSNYSADIFAPLFERLGEECGHRYEHTMPDDPARMSDVEFKDCAFRVIADHIRALTFAIADGIMPGNEGRHYVLRRILRRAVMFGKRLELRDGFFAGLVPVLVDAMGAAFPELRRQQTVARKAVASEEAAFDKTIGRGLRLFEKFAGSESISGENAFTLYDTYGFPLDLTQLLARERGIAVDTEGFEREMDKQRERARAAQKKDVIRVKGAEDAEPTEFDGYDAAKLDVFPATLEERADAEGETYLIFDRTPFYAEMGGQVGDTGQVTIDGHAYGIIDTLRDDAGRHLHKVAQPVEFRPGAEATLTVDRDRRRAVQRHHSATHLLNWALRRVVGDHIRQAGSLVAPDHLRFDFTHFEALGQEHLDAVEELMNEAVLNDHEVRWYEIPYAEKPDDVIAVFGEKYGDTVRVVDIGGFSRELCGGTHAGATGEIGLCKIVSETGIAAGTRRVEAVCGEAARSLAKTEFDRVHRLAQRLSCQPSELEPRVDAMLRERKEQAKEIKRLRQQAAAKQADALAAEARELEGGLQCVVAPVEASEPNELRGMANRLASRLGEGIVVLGAAFENKLSVAAAVTPDAVEAGYQAGEIVRDLTGLLGGKGGGKPDFAMGGAPNEGQLERVLQEFSP